jgi:hypothetical protein
MVVIPHGAKAKAPRDGEDVKEGDKGKGNKYIWCLQLKVKRPHIG